MENVGNTTRKTFWPVLEMIFLNNPKALLKKKQTQLPHDLYVTKSFTQQSCVSITKSPLFSAESDPEWEQHRELVWTNCASQRSPSLGTKALVAVLLSRTSALRSEMMDGIPHKKKKKIKHKHPMCVRWVWVLWSEDGGHRGDGGSGPNWQI